MGKPYIIKVDSNYISDPQKGGYELKMYYHSVYIVDSDGAVIKKFKSDPLDFDKDVADAHGALTGVSESITEDISVINYRELLKAPPNKRNDIFMKQQH